MVDEFLRLHWNARRRGKRFEQKHQFSICIFFNLYDPRFSFSKSIDNFLRLPSLSVKVGWKTQKERKFIPPHHIVCNAVKYVHENLILGRKENLGQDNETE